MNNVTKLPDRGSQLPTAPLRVPALLGRLAFWMNRASAWPPDVPRTSETIAAICSWKAALKAGLEPATRREIAVELAKLANIYASTRRTKDEWAMLYDAYAEDLREIPYDILRHACSRYRCDPASKFFPSPGQLLEHCEEPLAQRRSDLAGLEKVNTKVSGAA